ncbi:uncharacterized protein [Spinacia oleracea]|uniref:GRF-type domain-containing protein n=1 Tax=Spinacia oleracea TaxID=3562 RepID=A0ABM3R5D6_SPIOL|nr:uncharacterized protein LOC110778184 [Spinacia oleracea]
MVGSKQVPVGSSSSNSRGGMVPPLLCECGNYSVVRTVKRGPNVGMKFHGCPLWPDTKCEFFRWILPDNNELDHLQLKIFEANTTIAEMEYDKKLMEEKIKKLQTKKDNMEEDVQEMKNELCQMRIELMKSPRNERNCTMALYFSWVFFALLVFWLK